MLLPEGEHKAATLDSNATAKKNGQHLFITFGLVTAKPEVLTPRRPFFSEFLPEHFGDDEGLSAECLAYGFRPWTWFRGPKETYRFRVSGWFKVEASEGLEFGASKIWGENLCPCCSGR